MLVLIVRFEGAIYIYSNCLYNTVEVWLLLLFASFGHGGRKERDGWILLARKKIGKHRRRRKVEKSRVASAGASTTSLNSRINGIANTHMHTNTHYWFFAACLHEAQVMLVHGDT